MTFFYCSTEALAVVSTKPAETPTVIPKEVNCMITPESKTQQSNVEVNKSTDQNISLYFAINSSRATYSSFTGILLILIPCIRGENKQTER